MKTRKIGEKGRANPNTPRLVLDFSAITIYQRCQKPGIPGEMFRVICYRIHAGSSRDRAKLFAIEEGGKKWRKIERKKERYAETILGRVAAKGKHVDHSFVLEQLYPHGGHSFYAQFRACLDEIKANAASRHEEIPEPRTENQRGSSSNVWPSETRLDRTDRGNLS